VLRRSRIERRFAGVWGLEEVNAFRIELRVSLASVVEEDR
jgi:hypothetical protein